MADSKLIHLTGLWKKTTRDGKTFLTGNLNDGATVLIFANDRKEKDNHPDYRLYLAPREREERGERGERHGSRGGGERGERYGSRGRREEPPVDGGDDGGGDDDIPF